MKQNLQFYIIVNDKKQGPFTLNELKNKNIKDDTLVWTTNFENWTKAKHIIALKEIIKNTPPPVPDFEQQHFSAFNTTVSDKYFGHQLATRKQRCWAWFIDYMLLLVPTILFSFITLPLGGIGGLAFNFIYGAIVYPMWGGNVGHKITGLKVISSETGQNINNVGIGALREGLKSAFSIIFIPIVWLLWDSDKQNLYDKVLNTYVVKI